MGTVEEEEDGLSGRGEDVVEEADSK